MPITYKLDVSETKTAEFVHSKDVAKYLQDNLKIDDRKGQLAGKVTIDHTEGAVTISTTLPKFSKRSIRYYVRRFLNKEQLTESFRVIATSKDTYTIRVRHLGDDEEEEEEDDE